MFAVDRYKMSRARGLASSIETSQWVTMKNFDIVYVLTRGGPAHYSEVLASYLYYYSFAAGGPNKMGVGASVAFVIFACILTIALTRIIISKRITGN